MKQQITLVLLVGCLFGGLSTASAKKKPVIEHIDARIAPAFVALGRNSFVTIVIFEYSTDEELQVLAQTFAKRGKDGLESALSKLKKGYVQAQPGPGSLGFTDDLPAEVIVSKLDGAVRRLTIVAERGQSYAATRNMQADNISQEYPYLCVQLELDAQGNGKGELVQFANLGFDSAGHLTINRYNTTPFQLIDVRSSK